MIYPYAKSKLLEALKTPRIDQPASDKLLHNARVCQFNLNTNIEASLSKKQLKDLIERKMSTYNQRDQLKSSTMSTAKKVGNRNANINRTN